MFYEKYRSPSLLPDRGINRYKMSVFQMDNEEVMRELACKFLTEYQRKVVQKEYDYRKLEESYETTTSPISWC